MAGQAVAYSRESWPLLDDPWVHQDFQDDYLTVKLGDSRRVYDFKAWSVSSHGHTSRFRVRSGLRPLGGPGAAAWYDLSGRRFPESALPHAPWGLPWR